MLIPAARPGFTWITLFTLLNAGVMYLLILGAMSVALLRWQRSKPFFARGALLVAIALLLGLPFDLVIGWHTDVSKLVAVEIPTEIREGFRYIGAASALIGVVVAFAFRMFQVPATVILAPEGHRPFPGLLGGEPQWRSMGLGALIGALGAAISVPLFVWLHVGYGEVFEQLQELYHINLEDPAVLWGALFPMALGAAISEELLYRGVLQQGLCKLFKQDRVGVIIAVCISSLVWAVAHIGSADNNLLKVIQIFILGLAFGWLSRKHSLEASIAAHLSMNFFSVVVGALVV